MSKGEDVEHRRINVAEKMYWKGWIFKWLGEIEMDSFMVHVSFVGR